MTDRRAEEDWQYRKRRALRTVALYENSRDVLRVLDALTANGNLRDYDDEMVFHLIGETFKHRPPAFKFEYTVEQTRKAISAALRAAGDGR